MIFQKSVVAFGRAITCQCKFSNSFYGFYNQLRLRYIDFYQFRNCSSLEYEYLYKRPEIQCYFQFLNDEYKKYEKTIYNESPVLYLLRELKKYENDLKNLYSLSTEDDKEMEQIITDEKENLLKKIKHINHELLTSALPSDINENRNIILEVSPGIGGTEAKLFAEEIFHMYFKYATYKRWNIIEKSYVSSEGGGIRTGRILLSGDLIFKHLKNEAGIHRVQRVPETEKSGRIHTSTCRVTVVPEAGENDVKLNDTDLKIETKTSSAPGGQNVNKVETCVRVTHLPTGIITESQSHRYQLANKQEALRKLKNLLHHKELEKNLKEINQLKKDQAGIADRSEKIRTYNFNQNRVTDHRLNYSISNLIAFMEGNKELDRMISTLIKNHNENCLLWNVNRILAKQNLEELFKMKSR